jgi:hypothetical protein
MPVYTAQEQIVIDLRKEGYDCFQIARKLELTVPEVEHIVYGFQDEDIETLLMWTGSHY